MSTSIAQFLQPFNLRALNIYGSNVSSTGTLTWGTAVDICSAAGLATFEQVRFRTEALLEMIKASDHSWNNYLIGGYDFDMTVMEVIPDNGVGALVDMSYASTHMKAVASYGRLGSSSLIYVGAFGPVGPVEFGIQAGKNVASLTIKPAGTALYIGTSAPTF